MISPYLLAIIVSWPIAQGAKYVVLSIKHRKFNHLRQLYLSGNMPSAHSATVMALVTTIALIKGIDSATFALAALFAGVVMYDAVMVRRSVGEQGKAVQQIIRKQKLQIGLPRAAKGHTPAEVAAGAVVGIVVGIVVFLATR